MISSETIKYLKENIRFSEFLEDLQQRILELNSVKDLEKLNDKEAGQQAKARALAIDILLDIISPIINTNEKKKITDVDVKIAKRNFGL